MRLDLRDAPLAIVDLETTGTRAASDRITEIAILEVDGLELVSRWSTLVNPGASIPSPIQALTGITNEMVAAAPKFAELADALHDKLSGRVFVAHNARFDYGFLRREFARLGMAFEARTLCSVRLSRRLYRGERRHDLDSVIARHGLACSARHRALGDADALWAFLKVAAAEHGPEVLNVAARQISREPSLPPHVDRAMVDEIPEAPGVYQFYGDGGALLYVGKSRSLRSRVLAHFASDMRSEREMELVQALRRIEWQRTAGELGALLREAKLVKERAPAFNRQLRESDAACGFVFDGTRLRLAQSHEIDADTLPLVRGLARSRRAALQALRALADDEGLCLQTLGLEGRRAGACFRHQIGRCAGVCAGKENVHLHHARVAAALGRLASAAWPYRGPVGVVEHDREREATEIHVVDRWCYVGSARSEDELAEMLGSRRPARFEYDEYRILSRHVGKRGVRTVELGA
ncbi:MAG TPA: exonuclease domain-containing protein [Burkholderiales bacterium]|jgi:DNA polymerase-3 subunit epsilon|nr:exonuclease domain-containing protein [Burkholderiales bacterium]